MQQLYTRWGKAIDPEQVLQEYPRPRMVRESYENLNGYWEYAFVKADGYSGRHRAHIRYEGRILVPFSPESVLSGVNRQLMPDTYLFYRKVIRVTDEIRSKRLLLHFGAVDQACKVWVNGTCLMRHTGGYLPFQVDITDAVQSGENEVVVQVRDLSDTSYHSRGKQKLKNGGMFYTAQSGIWQTVWMEYVEPDYIQDLICTCLYDESAIQIEVVSERALPICIRIRENGQEIAVEAGSNEKVVIPLNSFRPWTPEHPNLYSFVVEMGADKVESYFAMRMFSVEPDEEGIPRMCLNHAPYFQYGVLDQGYWPDGLYTAPSDEALLFDIVEMKRLGFQMIRKHIKIEPQRWYYHCDRLGMIVWQDMVCGGHAYKHWFVTYAATVLTRCGLKIKDIHAGFMSRRELLGRREFRKETKDMIRVLYSHPSIAVWCIFNEGWGQFQAEDMTQYVRRLDPTRLIDQASGWFDQGGGDMQSIHNYFFKMKCKAEERRATVLSEFGGYVLCVPEHNMAGKVYGYRIYHTKEELNKGYLELVEKEVLPLIKKGLCASVYTQLSDVEDEVNGIFTYDREVCKIEVTIKEI